MTLTGRMQNQRGFALIELMVVIVIMGILMAVAIPAFLNQREKGQDACARSQVHTIHTSIEVFYSEHSAYTGADFNTLGQIEPSVTGSGACGSGTVANIGGLNGGVCDAGIGTTVNSYCISQSSSSGRTFLLALESNGTVTRSCTPTGVGCESGRW